MIEQYSHGKHFVLLVEWFDARKEYGLLPWMLPDFGLVVDRKAAAFLVTTNSPVAWIAHWVFDPKLSKKERDEIFHKLTDELEEVAREKGFRLLQTLGMVGHNLSGRLRGHGFSEAKGAFTFFVKDLDQGA